MKQHPHAYDLTSKDLLSHLEKPLFKFVLGKKPRKIKPCQVEFPKIQSQRADAVFEVTLAEETLICHVELQTDNDPEMIWRMLDYRLAIERKLGRPAYQILIYLGKAPMTMQAKVERKRYTHSYLDYGYHLLDFRRFRFEELKQAGIPELLAFLALTRSKSQPEEHLRRSVTELVERTEKMPLRKRQDLLLKAEILAGLRYDQDTIRKIFEEIGQMFMLEQSSTYQLILEKGIEQGIMRGIEQGIEKGIEQGIEKGIEQGIEKGIEQGIERGVALGQREGQVQGQVQALQEAICDSVIARFGKVPRRLRSRISKLQDPAALKSLLKVVVVAESLKQLQSL